MASIASDAAKAALAQLDAELVLPPGYKPCLDQHSTSSVHSNESTGSASGSAGAPQGKPASAGQRKGNVTQQQGSVAEELQRLVADVSDTVQPVLSRSGLASGTRWAHEPMQNVMQNCRQSSTS
jgi:hypothetical protein